MNDDRKFFTAGAAYERIMGRWSQIVGAKFIEWLATPKGLRWLKALRKDVIDPKIAEYGGRIFKTTGDGFLAEFPSAVWAGDVCLLRV